VGLVIRRDTGERPRAPNGASQKQQTSDGSPLTAPQCWQVFITVPFCAADVSPNGIRESQAFYQQPATAKRIASICRERDTPGQPVRTNCNLWIVRMKENFSNALCAVPLESL
jgi:hypothetical protein